MCNIIIICNIYYKIKVLNLSLFCIELEFKTCIDYKFKVLNLNLFCIELEFNTCIFWVFQCNSVENWCSSWFLSEDTQIWNNSLDIESIDPFGENLTEGAGKKQLNRSKSLYQSESRGRTPTKPSTGQNRPNTLTNHYPVTKAPGGLRQAPCHTGTRHWPNTACTCH